MYATRPSPMIRSSLMQRALFSAALCLAGTAQAQSWTRFIDNGPWVPNELAARHGLALDGTGGVFVKAMNTTSWAGTQFSHLYSLTASGDHAWGWSVEARPWDASVYVSRGYSASQGHRVAWFEV